MARWPGFVGPSYQSLSKMLNGEVTMNFYPEIVAAEAPNAKARAALYPCPGVLDVSRANDGPGRGMLREDSGRVFAVCGQVFGELGAGGQWTPRGAVIGDANPSQMATNGNDELFTVSGTKGYLFNLTSSAFTVEVTDVTMCGAIDTFLLALDAMTGTLKMSEPGDGTTWDPGQVVQRSAMPDPWVSFAIARKEIILIGRKSGEVWFNDGSSPIPFTLRVGSVFEVGIEAEFTLVPYGGSVAWLGNSDKGGLGVYGLNGYEPYKISTLAVDAALQGYRDEGSLAGAVAWTYSRLGHDFYVLDLPRPGKAWVYDKQTDQWHQRGRWVDNDFAHYRPRFYVDGLGYGLVLDSEGTGIYRFSETVYTDIGGGVLRRVRQTPLMQTENRRVSIDYLEFEAQRGVGLNAGQGVDPQLMVRMSYDGGNTWGNERTVGLGKAGHYDERIIKHKWGSGRNPCVQIACSDPVPVRLFDLYYGAS